MFIFPHRKLHIKNETAISFGRRPCKSASAKRNGDPLSFHQRNILSGLNLEASSNTAGKTFSEGQKATFFHETLETRAEGSQQFCLPDFSMVLSCERCV
ncbi:hypothetical protein CEXT_785501 [Caerostris extrusa]|uniref:Uncharacterized protein n=1 Tax=Caerostris extrusa TaxID=172846 RepID=A0AAV4W6I4_CAEEX|nr:hypothetical protein CEXT_785501 [Caerostris extrusa]